MRDECRGVENWFNCLSCRFLSTHLCPLEGEDAIDRIANRIRMAENPSHNGFKKEFGSSIEQ